MEFMYKDLLKLFKKNQLKLDVEFDRLCQEHSIGEYYGKDALKNNILNSEEALPAQPLRDNLVVIDTQKEYEAETRRPSAE